MSHWFRTHRVTSYLPLVVVFTVGSSLFGAGACGDGGNTLPPSGNAGSGGSNTGGSSGIPIGGSSGSGPSCKEVDADGDGIADDLEPGDTDNDGIPDAQDPDSDNDGVSDKIEAGSGRTKLCTALIDTDSDGTPDVRDLDSDSDGVPDQDELAYDTDGSHHCVVNSDCDGDGVVDVIELAAGSDPLDKASIPPDATLYFVLPFKDPEKTRDFDFSAGVKKADIYFMIDTTSSMQPAIDNMKASLNSTIIPKILNGDTSVSPEIPAIPDAWVGIGDFRDVPWPPYGASSDEMYRSKYTINQETVYGNVAPPLGTKPNFTAPDSVNKILPTLVAEGGGDAPEGVTQALWMATSGMPYQVTLGGFWKSTPPQCGDPSYFGTPCFRPDALPIFVIVTDAPFHQGPNTSYNYTNQGTSQVGGAVTYAQTVDALNQRGAKVIGVAVATGAPGAARTDLTDLAEKTSSLYYTPAFGGSEKPLVTKQDTSTGEVSTEVVNLIGLLAGQGLNNVTTQTTNYSCAGNVDCNGDGTPDAAYENAVIGPDTTPFDASKLVVRVESVPSTETPLPYSSLDGETFYGVRGDKQVTFRVHAMNDVVNPTSLTVVRAKLQVKTPGGKILGGKDGVKIIYFVIPRKSSGVKLETVGFFQYLLVKC
jgi:hypothetical protein